MGVYFEWSSNRQTALEAKPELDRGTGPSCQVAGVEKRAAGGRGMYLVWSADGRTAPPVEQKQVESHRMDPVRELLVKPTRLDNRAIGRRAAYFALAAVLIAAFGLHYNNTGQTDIDAHERVGSGKAFLSHRILLHVKRAFSHANSKKPSGMIALALQNLERAQESLSKLRDSVSALPNPPQHILDYSNRLNRIQAELADAKSYLLIAWVRNSEVYDRAENQSKEASDSNGNLQAVLSDLEQCRDNLTKALETFRLAHLHVQEVQRNLQFFPDPSEMDVFATMQIVDHISKANLAAQTSHEETTQLLASIKSDLHGDGDQGLDPDSLSRSDGVLLLMPDQGSPAPINRMGPGKGAIRPRAF